MNFDSTTEDDEPPDLEEIVEDSEEAVEEIQDREYNIDIKEHPYDLEYTGENHIESEEGLLGDVRYLTYKELMRSSNMVVRY